jgi:hypothetical protein
MFRIYFQTGQFYGDQGISWISIFKDFLIPLAGVGIPLLMFYLGLKQERIKADQQRKIDEAKSAHLEDLRLLYFHSLFKEAFKHCLHFQDVLVNLIQVVKKNRYYTGNLALDGDTDLKRIVFDLDRESLFYAYRSKIDDLSLNVIFKALDGAYGLRQTFSEAWSKANDGVVSKKNELRSVTADFGLRVLHVEAINIEDTELKARLMHIFFEYAKNEHPAERDCYELIEGLVNPFMSTAEDFGKIMHPLWSELFSKVGEAQIIDNQVTSIMQQYSLTLEELNSTLNRVVSDLYKHYLPLEVYLVKNSLLTEKLLDDDEHQEGKM